MAFNNNVATHRLVLNHDDETHDSIDVVPGSCNLEPAVNADNNSLAGVTAHFENMGISRSSNGGDIGGIATIVNNDAADTCVDIDDIKMDNNDILNTVFTTSDIDESSDIDNKNVDAADTNNNKEVTRINDILNVTEDNNDVSYTVLSGTFDMDESTDDANSIVDEIDNTNRNNGVTLMKSPIPNDQNKIDSAKTNAPLAPTFDCNESTDMPNIIRIVAKPRTNNTNMPFSKAVTSPLPSSNSSTPSLPNMQGPKPFLPNEKRSGLPVPNNHHLNTSLGKRDSRPSLRNNQGSSPSFSNDQGSIPALPDMQSSRPYLPDHRTFLSSMIIPQIAFHTPSCSTCPSQLIIQPQILVNMETYCNSCSQRSWPNAQFPPPQYPRFNSAPLPYPHFNRAPLPHRQYNRAPSPYPQFSRAPPRMQQGEQITFVPRRNGQSEPRPGPYPLFKRIRTPYMEHWQRNPPRPKNFQPMHGNFPPPQGPFPHSYNNRLPNMGFSRSATSFPSFKPRFQPQNPNRMLNAPTFWRNNVPDAPIYPLSFHGARPPDPPIALPSFHGAPPVPPMPPPSFYPGQKFPDDFNEFHESASSRFAEPPPPGFENVVLKPHPEISGAHKAYDIHDQIERKEGQLPLYLRKT